MSILIKGMEMPQNCAECPLEDCYDGYNCRIVEHEPWRGDDRPSWCPLIELPPHGDLIDRDEGIKIGAELAAMHGSDATTQELEKEYWRGYEDAMRRREVERKHGKWTWKGHYLICSECGNESDRTNFCPTCGADMRERRGRRWLRTHAFTPADNAGNSFSQEP